MATARVLGVAHFGLVDTVKNHLSAERVFGLSQSVGESLPNTENAVTALVPTLLGAIVRLGSTEAGAEKLLGLARSPGVDPTTPPDNATFAGQNLLNTPYGDRLPAVGQALTRFTGVGADTIQKLLAGLAPVALTALAAKSADLTPPSLVSYLEAQRTDVEREMPRGLNGSLQKTFSGLTSVAGGAAQIREAPTAVLDKKWAGPAVFAAFLLLAAILLFGTLPNRVDVTAITPSNQQFRERLALDTIAPPYRISFNDLTFDSTGMRLTPASRIVISQLAETLMLNPNLKIRIVGHSDDLGNVATNRRISLDRAEVVKAGLQEKGIAADRIETAGRGATEPVATNTTLAGRRANRRIEIVVLQK